MTLEVAKNAQIGKTIKTTEITLVFEREEPDNISSRFYREGRTGDSIL
jgi:hypothetical protein